MRLVQLPEDALIDVEEHGGNNVLPLSSTSAPVIEWMLEISTTTGLTAKRILGLQGLPFCIVFKELS